MNEFLNKFEDYGIDVAGKKPNADGEVRVICPVCSPFRKDKNRKIPVLGVNIKEGVWGCNHCGFNGHLLTKDFADKKKIVFFRDTSKNELSEKAYQMFEARGISRETVNKLKIGFEEKELLIKHSKIESEIGEFMKRNCIAFRYYSNGRLVNTKYRDAAKNFGLRTGGMLTLYNIDATNDHDYAIICEGEFDCASWVEIGFESSVSVPNGVALSMKEKDHYKKTGKFLPESRVNTSYLDNCIDRFYGKKIYLSTDDDPPGMKLREELARRFGKENCKKLSFKQCVYEIDGVKKECKDANDVLKYCGPDALKKIFENAQQFPIDEIVVIDECTDAMLYEFNHGKTKGISTGWECMDSHFNWKKGETTVLNGYANLGKTTLMLNMVLMLAIKYKWKIGIYTPENYPVHQVYDTLAEILVGNTSDKEKKDRMSEHQYIEAINFLKNHIFLIGAHKRYTPAELREIARQLVEQYGIDMFVKDPWKTLKHQLGSMSIDNYLENELSEEVQFGIKHNIVSLICTHPPTPIRNKEKEYPAPSIYEIKGGEAWSAMVYNILCMHQEFMKGNVDSTFCEFHVQKVKNQKLVGIPTNRTGPIQLKFHRRSSRFLEENGNDPFVKALNESQQLFIEGF